MSKKISKALGIMVILALTLMIPVRAFAGCSAANSKTQGEAGVIAGALGIAAMFGCIPCGVVAGGIVIGMGILQDASSDCRLIPMKTRPEMVAS